MGKYNLRYKITRSENVVDDARIFAILSDVLDLFICKINLHVTLILLWKSSTFHMFWYHPISCFRSYAIEAGKWSIWWFDCLYVFIWWILFSKDTKLYQFENECKHKSLNTEASVSNSDIFLSIHFLPPWKSAWRSIVIEWKLK